MLKKMLIIFVLLWEFSLSVFFYGSEERDLGGGGGGGGGGTGGQISKQMGR